MGGILLYNLFLVFGFISACFIFKDKNFWYKLLAGGVIGNVWLMFGVIPVSIFLGFTLLSHIVLIIISIAVLVAVTMLCKPSFTFFSGEENNFMPKSALFGAVLPITFIICYLMTNHILMPVDGGVASGQSTYGDLSMHMGFINSIAEQKIFPPEYSLMAGNKLSYPFLVDSLSSSLLIFGTNLRSAILIPSYVMAFLLVLGFYSFANNLVGKTPVSILACWFFFINGAFGFAYFFEGAKEDHTIFTRIFTAFYNTPTNFNEENIRWSNTICDMIIPQRTTMAGWMVLLFELILLKEAIEKNKTKLFVVLGVIAGAMPMIHTHSFLCLGIISAMSFFAFFYSCKDRKEYLYNWVIYGVIAIGMAMPQLFFWTFSQTFGNESFNSLKFNWVNHTDPYLWFWIKNWGIIFILMIPAFMNTSKNNKLFSIGAGVIFVISELVVFQQNEYDNNKLFYVVYMFAIVLVSEWLYTVFIKLKGVRGITIVSCVIILSQTLSGALTIGREAVSGGEYMTFLDADFEFAKWIKENTSAEDTFITGTQHLNPVNALAGRTLYVGAGTYIVYHGYVDEYNTRKKIVKEIYESNNYEKTKSLLKKTGAEYILVSDYEKNEFNVIITNSPDVEKVYSNEDITLYKIKAL